jgi:mannose-6-phosphate isomerase-like protein (cupin superfamily)
MQYVRPVDFAAFPADAFHSQRLADASTGLDSCVCLCTRVPPGTGTTSGLHVHPCAQLYYVLSGHMHADIGGQKYHVGPNTLVIIPAGVPHWNWNEGPDDEAHFEVLVPPPAPSQPVLTQVGREDGHHLPAGLQVTRSLNHALFEHDRFSEVLLADRASGLDALSLSAFRVPPGGEGPTLHVHRFDQIYFVIEPRPSWP